MKKVYLEPELMEVQISNQDIICTSGCGTSGTDSTEYDEG